MDVSIIIPLYKRTEWIGRCIERLIEQNFGGHFEIIVVDDGSPNGIEIRSTVERYSKVKYLATHHAGPATARNYGVRFASGKILCFLDDDSMPIKEWLREIITSFNNSESIALVSGLTLSLYRGEGFPLLLERAVYSGKSWATCNIAYRHDVFEKLGGFDESFKEPSWEDNDLGLRAKWRGYTHIFNERAVVYHPHERSLSEYKNKCLLNGRGAAVFSHKYLFKKPLWGLGIPLIMSRRLIYGIFPSVWKRRIDIPYLRFLWSFYSLKGFFMQFKNGKD